MGVIADVIAEPDAPNGSDGDDDDHDAGDSSPYLSRDEATGTIDPFLTRFNGEHVQLDDEHADRALGLLVVISNVFG